MYEHLFDHFVSSVTTSTAMAETGSTYSSASSACSSMTSSFIASKPPASLKRPLSSPRPYSGTKGEKGGLRDSSGIFKVPLAKATNSSRSRVRSASVGRDKKTDLQARYDFVGFRG